MVDLTLLTNLFVVALLENHHLSLFSDVNDTLSHSSLAGSYNYIPICEHNL